MAIQQKMRQLGAYHVQHFVLTNRTGMKIELMSWGATLIDVQVPDKHGCVESVTLAYDDFQDYEANPSFLGCVVGRVAGRIANSGFVLDGVQHNVAPNSAAYQLHGGAHAMWQRNWALDRLDSGDGWQSVTLSYQSLAGENGYPGLLDVRVRYILTDQNTLSIHYDAQTDAPTLCNLTNHAYFNLSGSKRRDVKKHMLQVNADAVCAMSDDLIVTGKEWAVADSAFDFRQSKALGSILNSDDRRIELARGIDHYFILNQAPAGQAQVVLRDELSGRRLSVHTDQPCVVLYAHNYANGEVLRDGALGVPHDALCIETQKLPHVWAINGDHPAALYPHQSYTQRTDFCFDVI